MVVGGGGAAGLGGLGDTIRATGDGSDDSSWAAISSGQVSHTNSPVHVS